MFVLLLFKFISNFKSKDRNESLERAFTLFEKFHNNLGFISGKNNKAYYFIGIQNDNKLIFSDPHLNQEITGKIKNDEIAFGIVNDKVLKTRLLSAKMCNVNVIDRPKLGYVQHYTPLSAFDYKNYDEYSPEVPKPKPKLTRPKTASEFASRHYKKYEDNLLGLRMKMGEFIENEQGIMDKVNFEKSEKFGGFDNVEYPEIIKQGSGNLKNKIKNEFKIELFKGEYNPAFGDLMSRPMTSKPVSIVYLPRPGTGLLNKPEEKKGKKKKRGKKKK